MIASRIVKHIVQCLVPEKRKLQKHLFFLTKVRPGIVAFSSKLAFMVVQGRGHTRNLWAAQWWDHGDVAEDLWDLKRESISSVVSTKFWANWVVISQLNYKDTSRYGGEVILNIACFIPMKALENTNLSTCQAVIPHCALLSVLQPFLATFHWFARQIGWPLKAQGGTHLARELLSRRY